MKNYKMPFKSDISEDIDEKQISRFKVGENLYSLYCNQIGSVKTYFLVHDNSQKLVKRNQYFKNLSEVFEKLDNNEL